MSPLLASSSCHSNTTARYAAKTIGHDITTMAAEAHDTSTMARVARATITIGVTATISTVVTIAGTSNLTGAGSARIDIITATAVIAVMAVIIAVDPYIADDTKADASPETFPYR